MLFINDDQAQSVKHNGLLNQCMGTNHKRRFPAAHALQHGGTHALGLTARQPGHGVPRFRQQGFEPLHQLGEMLLRQNLSGGHEGTLPTSCHGATRSQCRHHRLTRPHIPLEQAVHGHRASQIGTDFFRYTRLCSRQLKRQQRE